VLVPVIWGASIMGQSFTHLFSHKKYWAHRFGVAPVLPMSRTEMDALGWDVCDVILVTGDAYVDHPSFGAALIGRVLEAQGFRVGIISQPDWQGIEAFTALGAPALFFGVTAGNMDSMVNHYTAERRIRSDDAYTPAGVSGRRPDRATIVYAQRLREAFGPVPIILGGIEASLRRVAHFDYWSEKVRRSILLDSRADLLAFGSAERAVVEIAHSLATGENVAQLTQIRGTAITLPAVPAGWQIVDQTTPGRAEVEAAGAAVEPGAPRAVRLPSYDAVRKEALFYAHAARVLHVESNPFNARPLVQAHGDKEVWLNPPPLPLTTAEMDGVYDLPYSRRPHPEYRDSRIAAYEMIRHSVAITRGCFGGCTFCSITEHSGRIVQNRSPQSIVHEIESIRETVPGFTGVITDLGGPTANMYGMRCKHLPIEARCRRLSCVFPRVCNHLGTSHAPLIDLYRRARAVAGVKKITIGSGVRFDLAVRSPEYVRELAQYHTGGYLKIAPEHSEGGPLRLMMKPGIAEFERFREMFERFSAEAGKEQYIIPYFIAGHPGTRDEDMVALAVWLHSHDFRPDQVQAFLPTPMSLATAMYYSGSNPLRPLGPQPESVYVPKGHNQRRLHKAFLRYHDPENWPVLRQALLRMGRDDLIGGGKRALVPRGPGSARHP